MVVGVEVVAAVLALKDGFPLKVFCIMLLLVLAVFETNVGLLSPVLRVA